MTKEEIIEIGDIYIDALKNGNFEYRSINIRVHKKKGEI